MARKLAERYTVSSNAISWREAEQLLGVPINIMTAPKPQKEAVIREWCAAHGRAQRKQIPQAKHKPCPVCGTAHNCVDCLRKRVNRYTTLASQLRTERQKFKAFSVEGRFPKSLSMSVAAKISKLTSDHCQKDANGDVVLVYADGRTKIVQKAGHIVNVAEEDGWNWPVLALVRPMTPDEVFEHISKYTAPFREVAESLVEA